MLLLYTLTVVIVAVVGGALPAIATAVVAFALANWYFTPPIHTLTIDEAEDLLALVVFVVVAIVVSTVVANAARRTVEAERARAEAEILVRLTATVTTDDPLRSLITHLRSSFGLDGVAILDRREAAWHVVVSTGSDVPSRPEEADVVDELGPDVVLALRGRQLTVDDRRVLAAFATQLAAALERTRLSDAAASAGALGAGERAAGRAPASGVPRPPHAVGGDQGVGLEPAPGRRDLGRRTRATRSSRPSRSRPTASPSSSATCST